MTLIDKIEWIACQPDGTIAIRSGARWSVARPAAVHREDGAGDIAGLRIGEQQRGAREFVGRGPAAQRDLRVEAARTCGSSIDPSFSDVRNGPGASALTVIPVPASSTARLRVS